MCHILLQHYIPCRHTNIAFLPCNPEIRPYHTECWYSHPNYKPPRPNDRPFDQHDWVPAEWRDHSVRQAVAHSYVRLCPGCLALKIVREAKDREARELAEERARGRRADEYAVTVENIARNRRAVANWQSFANLEMTRNQEASPAVMVGSAEAVGITRPLSQAHDTGGDGAPWEVRVSEGMRYPRAAMMMGHADRMSANTNSRRVDRTGPQQRAVPDDGVAGGRLGPRVRDRRARQHLQREAETRDRQDRRARIMEAAQRALREREDMERQRRRSEMFQRARLEEQRIVNAAAAANSGDDEAMGRLQRLMSAPPVVATLPPHLAERMVEIGPRPGEEYMTAERIGRQLQQAGLVAADGHLRSPTPDLDEDDEVSGARTVPEGEMAASLMSQLNRGSQPDTVTRTDLTPRVVGSIGELTVIEGREAGVGPRPAADEDDETNNEGDESDEMLTLESQNHVETGSTVEDNEDGAMYMRRSASPSPMIASTEPIPPDAIWHEASRLVVRDGKVEELHFEIVPRCVDHKRGPWELECNDATHFRKAAHKDTASKLSSSSQHGDKPQPRNGRKESLNTETWEVMVFFQGCRHVEAVYVEKLQHANGEDIHARCGCNEFDRCLVTARKTSSLQRCLSCRAKLERARLAATSGESDGHWPWVERYARVLKDGRSVNLWPFSAKDAKSGCLR